jgi:hypothetical protein
MRVGGRMGRRMGRGSRYGNRATITKANGRTINALAMESTAGLMATATKAISSIAN